MCLHLLGKEVGEGGQQLLLCTLRIDDEGPRSIPSLPWECGNCFCSAWTESYRTQEQKPIAMQLRCPTTLQENQTGHLELCGLGPSQ